MNLRTLPLPLKVLATCFLITIGVAYLFAITYLYLIDVEPHTEHGMSVLEAVIHKYYGKREASRLEATLAGPMGESLSLDQQERIIQWVRQGAREAEFADIQPLLKRGCAGCHSPDSGMPIPPLSSYAEVSLYTAMDLGQSIRSLVRVSHIHLFGISFVFMLTSLIFAFSEVSRLIRSALIAIPFIAMWLDIGSWWFTKYEPLFAYMVIIGGAFMGLSLAGQIGISLYGMWLARSKEGET